LSIVIPAYGPPAQLAELLSDISRQELDPTLFDVLVVDDGSPTPIEPQLHGEERLPAFLRVVSKPNGGGPAARNFGAALAAGDRLLFLDQDLRIPNNFVRVHLELGRAFPGAAISTAYVNQPLDPSGSFSTWYLKQASEWTRVAREQGEDVADGVREVSALGLSSTNCSLSRAAFLKSGGFPVFRFSGMEDQAFGLVLSVAGVRVLRTTRAEARHLEARVNVGSFCERQRIGAAGAAEFASRFPEALGAPDQTEWNRIWGAPSSADSITLSLKKVVRRLLATRSGAAVLRQSVRATEALAPKSRCLGTLYSAAVGSSLQAGWRAGFAIYASRN